MPMFVATSESSSASIEFSSEVHQILLDFSNITPNESPKEPPTLSDIHHVCDLNTRVSRLITLSNDNHKSIVSLHNRLQEFAVGDEVELIVPHQMFPPGTWEKFHARCTGPCWVLRRIGSNAYELDILWEPEINLCLQHRGVDSTLFFYRLLNCNS